MWWKVMENIAAPFMDMDQWFYDHVFLHHSYTNSKKDPDVSGAPDVLRFLPDGVRWNHHRYQHVYLPWISGLTVFAKGLLPSILCRFNPVSVLLFVMIVWQSRFDMMKCLVLFMLPGPLFIIPAMLNHIQEECTIGGEPHDDFLVHQLETTVNYRTNRLTRLLSFNLDIQVEHHLFPNIAHSTLRRVQHVIRDFCHEHDLPYHEKPDMWTAYQDFQKLFATLGNPDNVAK